MTISVGPAPSIRKGAKHDCVTGLDRDRAAGVDRDWNSRLSCRATSPAVPMARLCRVNQMKLSAINPASVSFVFLQCEVVAYRLAACAEVARDYRRFVVCRLAPEESQVSRCEHQRHSYF